MPQQPDLDQRVCFCRDVDTDEILAAIHAGARDVEAVARATGATTGCGTCRFDIQDMLAAARDAPEPEQEPEGEP